MTGHADGTETSSMRSESDTGDVTVEAYKEDDAIVFYDAENPLAWIESNSTVLLADIA